MKFIRLVNNLLTATFSKFLYTIMSLIALGFAVSSTCTVSHIHIYADTVSFAKEPIKTEDAIIDYFCLLKTITSSLVRIYGE